jgi:excisionase family DNA binding protein
MRTKTDFPRLLLTVAEASESLGISRAKLYDLISRKKIKTVKIGDGRSGGVRFRPRDLEVFAEQHLVA